jgi:hypothetical protein
MEFARVNRFESACLTLLAAGIAVATPALADEAPVVMAAHHAVYKLSLMTAKGANAPATASGAIDYDFTGSACDGYTTNFRQIVEVQPTEGESKLNDMTSNTFESDAATDYTFNTKTTADDNAADTVSGKATRGGDGKIGVDIKAPQGHADFAADVLFPTQHLRHIIAAAEHGDKILSADIYDGSETGKKLFHTLTVIGAPLTDAPDDPAGKAEALKGLRRWPVVISYFEDGKDAPDYILSSDLYENGISRALKLDYGDFVLAGALDQLTVAPPAAPCKK